MEALPAALSMQMAITQQQATMGMMKKSAQMQQAVVNMISQGAEQIAASGRGQILNITA